MTFTGQSKIVLKFVRRLFLNAPNNNSLKVKNGILILNWWCDVYRRLVFRIFTSWCFVKFGAPKNHKANAFINDVTFTGQMSVVNHRYTRSTQSMFFNQFGAPNNVWK